MKFSVLGIFILCRFISLIVARDAVCKLPGHKPEFYVKISRCQNIYRSVYGPNPNSIYDSYIRAIACTVPGEDRSVCCKPSEVGPKSTTTTTTTTPIVPVSEVNTEYKLAPLPDDCGKSSADRIAYGNETQVFAHPWMVLLQYRHKRAVIGGCGRSINKRCVLTL